MAHPQLTLGEVRVLRSLAKGELTRLDAESPQTVQALRGLAAARLIETHGNLSDPDAVRITEQGREWLAVYGLGITRH